MVITVLLKCSKLLYMVPFLHTQRLGWLVLCCVPAGAFFSYGGMFEPGNGKIYTSLSGTPTVADSCTHKDDVGVYCMEEGFSVCSSGSARLTGSALNATSEGILEVCINNRWGTVCDDSWNEIGSDIACQMVFNNDSSKNHYTYVCIYTSTTHANIS